MTNDQAVFSSALLHTFIGVLQEEVGMKNLPVVLEKSGLPRNWANVENLPNLSAQAAAESYAGLQKAIRAYYGRGARGMLQRIGSKFFHKLLKTASFKEKAQSKLLRGFPQTRRRKAALDLLIRLLDVKPDEMSAHTLDLNLILVDNISPSTYHQRDDEPICHVTQGLIREAIYWATQENVQVEETSCHAMGEKNCEFKIVVGEN